MTSGIYIRSEENKKNISKALIKSYKKNPMSEERKKNIGRANKGRSINKGIPRSLETRKKISESRKGKKASEETKRNISKGVSGKGNSNWQGGISPFRKQIRHSYEYRQWRSDVFTRDNFTCQMCGDNKGGNLHAHHIKPFAKILQYYEITTIEEALDCEELWNINNGITLCEDCHKETDSFMKRV